MKIVLLLLLGMGIAAGMGRLLHRNGEKETADQPPYQLPVFSLKETHGGRFVEYEGARYIAYEGEETASGTVYCHWHGRMGEGMGLLRNEDSPFPVGELYHLLGDERNVFLSHLPQEGYPITDMLLLLREGTALPPIAPDAFCYGEIYCVSGEVPEESLEQIGTVTDPTILSALITAWTEGTETLLPHGEYERYRIRLHSKDRQGLYVSICLNVCREQNCFAVEKQGFGGDALLSPEQGWQIVNK